MKLSLEQYPDILTISQVADILSVSKATTYRLVEEGVIGSIRLRRAIRIPKINLIRFIEASTNTVSEGSTHLHSDNACDIIGTY